MGKLKWIYKLRQNEYSVICQRVQNGKLWNHGKCFFCETTLSLQVKFGDLGTEQSEETDEIWLPKKKSGHKICNILM